MTVPMDALFDPFPCMLAACRQLLLIAIAYDENDTYVRSV